MLYDETVVDVASSMSAIKPSSAGESQTRMGYGECSISGCPCQAFKDTYGSDLCNNCGHKFTDHW